MNQIDGVCQTIEKTISQAVQKTLDQLEKDSDIICSTISSRLEKDRLTRVQIISPTTLPGAKFAAGIFELINSIACKEEIKCRRILPASENVILKPDVICLHAELMWLTTEAPVFTHSRAEL